MTAILENIKLYCNVDDTNVYDTELLQLASVGLAALASEGIPLTSPIIDASTDVISLTDPKTKVVSEMDAVNLGLLQSWLNVYCFRFFDKQVLQANKASVSWLDDFQTDILWKLKANYDSYVPLLDRDWWLWYEIW